MMWNPNCENCRRRREAMIAAGKRMVEWIKRPVGKPPIDLSQKPQVATNSLPAAAPTSQPEKQNQAGRLDPRGRVRE